MDTNPLHPGLGEAHALSRASTADAHRPRYHFTAPANWLNDPNGLIQWQGRTHLFYQYNPNGAFHGTIHWGHAVSDDLVHWEDLPVALAPTPGGPDADGCWSGSAVNNQGTPTLVYSGVFPQSVCLATSSDELRTWQKHPNNPVIAGPPADLQRTSGGHFRDPFVWRADGQWRMVMGSKIEGVGGLVLLYTSPDLLHWECQGPILQGDVAQTEPFWTGAMWECPNLLDFGRRQALIISAQSTAEDLMYAFYVSGRFDGQRFLPDGQDILVHGGSQGTFYAPQVLAADDGRYLMWGWLKEGRSQASFMEAGWAGAMSLPLEVSMEMDGKLCVEPAAELAALRQDHRRWNSLDLADGELLLDSAAGDSLEIIARFDLAGAGEFGLLLRAAPDSQEYTRLAILPAERRVVLQRDRASLADDVNTAPCPAPIYATDNGTVTLHIFLDRSILEVFVNGGRSSLAARIYPTRADSLGLGLFSQGGPARLQSLDVWRLATIW
ncbi:MAG TPA: glycoside hydrolase family 32 protein [Anaerolineae bacterium]|nr:glycoside hydrolase family 32 protein [Anaerolineae bacterium]